VETLFATAFSQGISPKASIVIKRGLGVGVGVFVAVGVAVGGRGVGVRVGVFVGAGGGGGSGVLVGAGVGVGGCLITLIFTVGEETGLNTKSHTSNLTS